MLKKILKFFVDHPTFTEVVTLLAIILILILSLSSCSSPVKLAYDCPKLQLPSDPANPAADLTPQSSSAEVVKAWVATAKGYHQWNQVVRQQVDHFN